MIIKGLEVTPFATNCYVVGSETAKKGMIIDPGDEADVILKEAKRQGLEIVLIVATHNHTDHINGVRRIKESTGADFAIHEADARFSISESLSRTLGNMM